MHRHADGARLVRDRAGDRLADPPRGVRRELVTLPVVELVDRAHQSRITLLDQVEELEPAVRIALRDRDHEPDVRFDHLAFRLVARDLAGADLGVDLADLLAGHLAVDFDLADLAARALHGALELDQVRHGEPGLLLDVLQVLPTLPCALQENMQLFGAPVVVALEMGYLRLRLADVQRELLHPGREPLDQPPVEVERVEIAEKLFIGLTDLLDVRPALVLRASRGRLFLELHKLRVELAHPLHRLLGARPLPLRRILGVPVAEIDLQEILDPHLSLLEPHAHRKELLDDRGRAEERGTDLAFPRLDPLGDFDLPLAVEERDAPHLAQIHAHGVVVPHRMLQELFLLRPLLLTALQLELLLRLLVAVENVDLEVVERDVDLVHILHRGTLVQKRLDLVVEQVLLLASQPLELQETVRLRTLRHSLVSPSGLGRSLNGSRNGCSAYVASMQDPAARR